MIATALRDVPPTAVPAYIPRLTLLDAPTPQFKSAVQALYRRVCRADLGFLVTAAIEREGVAANEAHFLVQDYLRFACLCGAKFASTPQFSPTERIDKVWHLHILHTNHYAAFCDDHFDVFVHHTPYSSAERAEKCLSGEGPNSMRWTIEWATYCFGPLSDNWHRPISLAGAYGTCSGSTNCQSCSKCWSA